MYISSKFNLNNKCKHQKHYIKGKSRFPRKRCNIMCTTAEQANMIKTYYENMLRSKKIENVVKLYKIIHFYTTSGIMKSKIFLKLDLGRKYFNEGVLFGKISRPFKCHKYMSQ